VSKLLFRLYWFLVSASSPSTPTTPHPAAKAGGLRGFWQRVSEGRAIDDLWSQFAADARSSYGFYGKDVDWEEINKLPRRKRVFRIVNQFFWALLNKLSPARRILLLLALGFLVLSMVNIHGSSNSSPGMNFEVAAALLLLLLLSLELADKVIMKRDLEIAREIQAWLVPSTAPFIPNAEVAFHTRPQNSVAGDYYDAFYPNEPAEQGGKLMLVMADVAGKSVPAALLMATLQASLHTLAPDGLSLTNLMERVNRYACAHSMDGGRFTTAVVAEFDPSTQLLSYVNAGHNSPVVRRPDGSIVRLESSGLPLGITREATFPAAALQLSRGDTLILFTDGVVEAFDAAGQEYSDPRWVKNICNMPPLPAQDSLNFLMRDVDQFVGATRQSDDITLLVLCCK
jgi:sigma-B regulation protein RsbU (phosphoserine phosphatase)